MSKKQGIMVGVLLIATFLAGVFAEQFGGLSARVLSVFGSNSLEGQKSAVATSPGKSQAILLADRTEFCNSTVFRPISIDGWATFTITVVFHQPADIAFQATLNIGVRTLGVTWENPYTLTRQTDIITYPVVGQELLLSLTAQGLCPTVSMTLYLTTFPVNRIP